MDYHVIIVIACVFLASLLSILFINKFFKNKTYEEAAAEKKALVDKLYPTRVSKKLRKFPVKKDTRKDKKSRQNSKDTGGGENEIQDSDDIEEEETQSVESSPSHNVKSKSHVEFNPPQDVITGEGNNEQKGNKHQNKKKPGKGGILVNKTEASPIVESPSSDSLNHFDKQHPKDVIELKKQAKESHNDTGKGSGKNQKEAFKKAKHANASGSTSAHKKDNVEQPSTETTIVAKEVNITETMKPAGPVANLINPPPTKIESPKSQGNKKSTSNKSKHHAKEVNSLLDKIGQNDVISVNFLIELFAKAELNRNDIQILIDFLLNKQQDTATVAHEWSDDMVTKLKKQLNEKEKILQDEIDASAGLQAKLKELRTEINSERIQFNANIKAYTEELQSKKNEIALLQSDIQNLNEKFQLERQQFQAKLRHEKQVSSQELLQQIQQIQEHNTILQNEIVQKTGFIQELQRITNATHQTVEEQKQKINELNDICQQKQNQILSLETSLEKANETIQRIQYDLEVAKLAENEKESSKVEVRNLQNALETTKTELNSANNQLTEQQQKVTQLSQDLDEIKKNNDILNMKYHDSNSESVNLKNSIENMKMNLMEKDNKILEIETQLKKMLNREDDLLKQLSEQREKNNKPLFDMGTNTLATNSGSHNSEQHLRDIIQRLFPDAVKKHSTTSALSLSLDQWIEQTIKIHIENLTKNLQKQIEQQQNNYNNSNSSSSSNNVTNNNHDLSHNHNSDNRKDNNIKSTEVSNEIRNVNSSNISKINNSYDDKNSNYELLSENIKLQARVDELTKLLTSTENTLKLLENHARDEDARWNKIVQLKEEEINSLKNANGQAI